MVELLSRPVPGRAMLRLPTGAGKTRVAVEAVIRIARTKGLNGPILWIAQSNELCEQAVESWKFVWSKVGPEEKLTVNRFWGSNDAAPVTNNTQLVVATDAKLNLNLSKDEYAWLRKASVVIVDEAHRAISPRYTAILERLGLTRSRTERPLIGITATPFRGTNADETERLAARFGRYRIDDGLFPDDDPYAALQSIGVLANVDHRELQGSTLTLNEAEFAKMNESGGFFPSSAEERLAQDTDRNGMLLDEIAKLDDDWPVLVFATSVNHSKLLTAMLNGRGIASASIDSFTPMPERRNKIDDFRKGRIRVITNYGVLAQGFDAPATRAVVIARPTYSPNVYQQMIGRGLRGPKNGGKEMCLILDVHDNIENYGKSLAFTGFEHLWGIR
ncbi:MAG: DEAD/DEAH box helicase [Pseudonocardiaceae bacterium]